MSFVVADKEREKIERMEKIEVFENERAIGYDRFVETWIPFYHQFLDSLPRILRQAVKNELLVVGCGTGNEIERFVRAPERWEVTGIDPSPEMIRQARDKMAGHSHVKLVCGLLSDQVASRKFGAATLLLVLHFMEDDGQKLRLLKDISDRLEPRAPFVLLDITGDNQQLQRNLEILRLMLPDGLEEEEISFRVNRISKELHIVSEKRLSELFVEAGFEPPIGFFQASIYRGWLTFKV